MVTPSSPRVLDAMNRYDRGVQYSFKFLSLVLRHFILIAVFLAGIMIGWTLDKNESFYDTVHLRQDSATTEIFKLQRAMSVPKTTNNEDGGRQ